MTIAEAGRALRARRISSVELTKECLDQIGKLNPVLNAFITVTGETALARAEVGFRYFILPGSLFATRP